MLLVYYGIYEGAWFRLSHPDRVVIFHFYASLMRSANPWSPPKVKNDDTVPATKVKNDDTVPHPLKTLILFNWDNAVPLFHNLLCFRVDQTTRSFRFNQLAKQVAPTKQVAPDC